MSMFKSLLKFSSIKSDEYKHLRWALNQLSLIECDVCQRKVLRQTPSVRMQPSRLSNSINFSGDSDDACDSEEQVLSVKSQMRIHMSLLGDHGCAAEMAYDDLYVEDAWKRRLFRRYRQAVGLSPLSCLQHQSNLIELQRLQLQAEEEQAAHRNLEARVKAMQSTIAESLTDIADDEKQKHALSKCDTLLRWLATKEQTFATKKEYSKKLRDIELVFSYAFKKRLSKT